MREGPLPIRGWILYDGECGMCHAGVTRWGGMLKKKGMGVMSLQDPRALEVLQMDLEEAVKDFRVIRMDGGFVSGLEAYGYLWSLQWWTYPLYRVSRTRGGWWLMEKVYGWVSRNRYRVSRACRVPNGQKK